MNYYPAALGIFMVKCQSAETDQSKSIYDSGAVVKVYQGNTYLGKFTLSDLTVNTGESNRKYWSVLQIEQGYTKANSTTADDIYFRVVPCGSLATAPEIAPPSPGFYFNLADLPYNKTYTSYYDYSPFIADIIEPSKHMRMIGSKDGYLYSMYCNDRLSSTKRYLWRTGENSWHGYFPGSEITSIISNFRFSSSFHIGLKNNPTSSPWIGNSELASGYESTLWEELVYFQFDGTPKDPLMPMNGNWPLLTGSDNYGTYYLPEKLTLSDSNGIKVNCMTEYFDAVSGNDLIMIGSDNGPLDSNCQAYPGTDAALVTGNIKSLCPLTDENGKSNGEVLVSTDDKLWKYNSNKSVDHRWIEVVRSSTTDSISGVAAMVALNHPDISTGRHAVIVKNNGGAWTLGYNDDDGLGNPGSTSVLFYNNSWDTKTINSLKVVTIGPIRYLFYATNDGVYYRSLLNRATQPPIEPLLDNQLLRLSKLLDGINVLKIVDYDGRIGLLTENNGFIIGPYPPIKWNN